MDAEEEEVNKTKKRVYDIKYKLKVINYAEKHKNKSKAAKDHNVDVRRVRDWCKNKTKIEEQLSSSKYPSKTYRTDGAGRPLKDPEFDQQMIQWVKSQRENKQRVSRRILKRQALVFSKDESFKASDGWLQKFMQRHNLSLRRPTTVCQKEPVEFKETIVNYLLYVEQQRKKVNYQHIYAADETAVFIDYSNSSTLDTRGAKEVSIKTTGHEKLHITVTLTARSDGYKCKPFVLLPRVRPDSHIETKFRSKLQLSWCGRTFFNDDLTIEYLQKIFGPGFFGKRLFAWDSYRCHISERTKHKLKELNIDAVVIPGGCTKFIQAADVYWNSPFKARIRQLYEDWMMHGEKSYTNSENIRAPPMELYLSWIVDAWEGISKNHIVQSFQGCGLTTNLDGSEDHLIHCFKNEGPIPNGVELLQSYREENKLVESLELCEMDDEYESDSSII